MQLYKLLPCLLFTTLVSPTMAADVDVYLIAGQSNAHNFASTAATGGTNVGYTLDWAITTNSLTTPYSGTANSFSSSSLDPNKAVTRLATALGASHIGIYGFARNGTPIALETGNESWYPGADPANGAKYESGMYSNFVTWSQQRLTNLTNAGHTPVVKGIFWFQGERDAVIGTSQSTHQTNFANLILRMREDFGTNIPIVATKIREVGSTAAVRAGVNQAMYDVAATDSHLTVVTTDGLTWRSSTDVHLTDTGYFNLAPRWTTAMLALQSANISWKSSASTTSKAVLIEGNTVVALNAGSTAVNVSEGGATGTSNYSFSATSFTNLGTHFFTPTAGGTSASDSTFANVYSPEAITSTGDTDFDTLISSISHAQGISTGITAGTFTLNGLENGRTYLIQIFSNDQRDLVDHSTITIGDNKAVPNNTTLAVGDPAAGVQSAAYGQYTTGTFTANGTSQTISMLIPDTLPPATNLLVNGDFELPSHNQNDGTDPDSWNVTETAIGQLPERQVRTKQISPHGGLMTLQLGAGNSNHSGKLSQVVTTVVGQEYTFSIWAFSVSNQQGFSVDIRDNVSSISLANIDTLGSLTNTYQEFKVTFTATSTSTIVEIADNSSAPAADGADMQLDDASLTATGSTDPATATLRDIHMNAILVTAPSHFQLWAYDRGAPATMNGDHNGNGIPNAIEYAIGLTHLDTLQPDENGVLSQTLSKAAIDDGYSLKLEYSETLGGWTEADNASSPVKLLSSVLQPNGDLQIQFEFDENFDQKLFWRLKIE